jgi:hypothetical protein
LVVNGQVVATVAPGAEVDVPTSGLGSRPWAIETRSPSGQVLSSLNVAPDAHYDSLTGLAVRADLSCGRLDVWLGPPLLGGTFIPGPSGDCSASPSADSVNSPSSQPSPMRSILPPVLYASATANVDQYTSRDGAASQ